MNDSEHWMLDDLPIGVWVAKAPEGRVVYANRAFHEILGMDAVPGSLIGDVPVTYGVRDSAGNQFPVERLPFSLALATGTRVTVDDMVIHRHDGVQVPLRAFAHPVKKNGTITHVIVAFTDISNEAKARADHATFEERLKAVVDHAPVVCWSTDREGIITLSEGAGLSSLGVRSGELVGQSVFELYREHPTISGNIRRALAGESFWYTTQVTDADAVYETWITPVRQADGELNGILAVSNDVSEIRRLQERTIQADRVMALGTLAASVAHEINNPLTYVLSYLEELEISLAGLDGGKVGERARRALEPVKKGVERIATITRDLRTFSRPDDLRLEPIDLGTVVESVLTLLRKEIEARARLLLTLEAARPVLANEARLVQVVLNLLLNAIQALPQGDPSKHQIAISVRDEGDWVIVEVTDSGPGVGREDRDRIFDPFVTTKPVGVGTGLGLFVCRNVVRGLGGDVSVGERAGGGAAFRVRLPVGERARRPSEPAPRPPPVPDVRVLVVEDDALVARSFADRLRSEGIAVELAASAEQALGILAGGAVFDLIYCDLMMKEKTGMDFAEELDARSPHLHERVVFMTGGAFTPRAAAFVEANADRCVDKPFDVILDLTQRLSRERA
jgi:PAS domain S-box-containing protein